MSKNARLIGSVLFIALVLAGCKGIENIEITSIDHFKFRGFEDNTITFSANVGIYNPSGVGFRVSEINLRAFTDGDYLGLLTNHDAIRIPARSDSIYSMLFDLRLTNIFSGAAILFNISRQEQVNVELQGYVKSRSGLVTKKIDVQERQVIDVPSLDFFN